LLIITDLVVLGAETVFSPPPFLILSVRHGKDKAGLYPPLNLKLKLYLFRVSCKFIINNFSDTYNRIACWTTWNQCRNLELHVYKGCNMAAVEVL